MRRHMPGLGSFPFARHYWGNRVYFLFLRVLRCFSSPRSPPGYPGITGSRPLSCLIRTSADQWVFAPPRGFSQLVTSFVASESQGIPHTPLSCLFIGFDTRSSTVSIALAFLLVALLFAICVLIHTSFWPHLPVPPFGRAVKRLQYVNVLFPWWRITESNR